MSVVFLSLFLNFELIQQVALVNFVFSLNIVKILKITFWTFGTKNCISLNLWALFSVKPCKAFRIAQCKQPRLVKPWLYFDINFTFRSTGTALVQVKRAFKNYFLWHKKTTTAKKQQTGFAWKFLHLPIQVCRGTYIPYFKINTPIFCCLLFFKEYLNPQVRINKMGNEHTVDYHHSPSELASRIHPLIFIWSPKGFISLEHFLNFFSNLYILLWLQKTGPLTKGREGKQGGHGTPLFLKLYFARDVFLKICFCVILQGIQNFFRPCTPGILSKALEKLQIYAVKITGRYICVPKNWIFSFLHIPQAKLSPRQKEITHFTRTAFFDNQCSPSRKEVDYGA